MKHELLYETQAQFTAAEGNSGNVTSITPGVAYIVETGTVPHFNKTYDNVTIVYKVTDTSSPTKLFNVDITNNLVKAYVDKVEVPVSDITSTYQFNTIGLHHILLRYSSITTLPSSAFTECINIVNIKLPDSLTSIGAYCFYGCTGLKKFIYPKNVRKIQAYCFHGCSNIERIYFKGPVGIDAGNQYQFKGCNKLRHVYFNNIQQLCNSSFYGTKNWQLFYHPCSQTQDCHLYFNNEEVFDITIPDGFSTLNNSNFAFCKHITAVTFSSDVRTIGNATFYACTGLSELNLPPQLRQIRDYTFAGCTGLTGTIEIPNTVSSMGQFCFYNCTNFTGLSLPTSLETIPINCFDNCKSLSALTIPDNIKTISNNAFTNCSGIIGSILIPDSVKSIGQYAFSGCTKVDYIVATGVTSDLQGGVCSNLKNGANVTLKTTGGFYHSVIGVSGTNIYNNVTLIGGWVSRSGGQTVPINNFTFSGNYNSSNNPLQGRLSAGYNCIVAKIGGNLTASNPNNYFHSGTNRLKFFELMGTINETFVGVATSNETLNSSGCIYHLGYNGIACTPAQANADYLRLTTIYVGDGSSEDADRAVLNQYLANTDWTQYAGKLDIWYNYHGEYREE